MSYRAGASKRANAFLCPRCGMGQGPRPKRVGLTEHYKRAYADLATEHPQQRRARQKQCESYLLKMAKLDDAPLTVLELRAPEGAESGHQAANWTLVDPNCPALPDATHLPFSLQYWAKTHTECVDFLLSTYLLEYLEQPRAHLRAIARALRPTGKARIEVRNLCSFPNQLESQFLDSQRPNLFSPHALTTMCSHAGLAPLEIDIASTITLVCRRALDHERPRIFSGPSAQYIAKRCREASCLPQAPLCTSMPRIWS